MPRRFNVDPMVRRSENEYPPAKAMNSAASAQRENNRVVSSVPSPWRRKT